MLMTPRISCQTIRQSRSFTTSTKWPPSFRAFAAGEPIVTRKLPYLGCVQIDFGTVMLNFGATTSLGGFMMTDVMALRSMSIVGSLCGVIYNTTRTPKQLNAVAWGFVFIAVNTVQIIRLILEREEPKLSVDEADLFFRVFSPYGVEAKLFLKLMNKAEWKTYERGDALVAAGKPLNRVHLLVEGSATSSSPTKGDLYVYSASNNGAIIGATAVVDPSILGRDYPNTIRANEQVRAVSFNTQELRKFLKDHEPNVEAALMHLMYVDLIGALRRDRKLSAALDHLKQMVVTSTEKNMVSTSEKENINEFIKENNLTEEHLRVVLTSIGWSEREWKDGAQNHRKNA